jgi:hypothetical protein
MVVLKNGNIGIGTGPSYKLDVSGDVNASAAFAPAVHRWVELVHQMNV